MVPAVTLGERRVYLGAPDELLPDELTAPFIVLVPAFDRDERDAVERGADDLLERGCVELCCVGPESEALHDALDSTLEDRGFLHVVTTWHTDATDACEYFLFAAGGGRAPLLALVARHAELIELLKRTALE
jgi:hypothetical protein